MNFSALLFKPKRDINLLPKNPFEESLLGRVLAWGLTIGKWIAIGTELIVASVFLYRFSLDRKLNNYRKRIAKEVARIEAYKEIENSFRLAQARVVLAKPILAGEEKIRNAFLEQARLVPADVWLSKLEVSKNQIRVIAYSASVGGFNQFLQNLRESQKFEKISIQNIESGAEEKAKLKFSLTATFKGE